MESAAGGIVRLTSLSLVALLQAVNDDATCGFKSPGVSSSLTGELGDLGTQTSSITRCTLDFTQKPVTFQDCTGKNTKLAHGKVVVTAVQKLTGSVSGDASNPIIPANADALEIDLTVLFTDFQVESDAVTDATLLLKEGTLSAALEPRLAVSKSTGFCTVPTGDLAIENAAYDNASLLLSGSDGSALVFVPTSSFNAQIGAGASTENSYGGTITVFSTPITLPPAGDEKFQTDYDRTEFERGFLCTFDLATPVTYDCGAGPALSQIGDAIARLTVQNFGTLASLVESDPTCGFSSPNSKANVEIHDLGNGLGDAVFRATSCAIAVPQTVVGTDCNGAQTVASGRAVVTGTKTIRGLVTGSTEDPILPNSDTAITIELTRVDFDNFRVGTKSGALTQLAGSMAGSVTPRSALSTRTNICSVSTPSARFDDLAYESARLLVTSTTATIATFVPSSSIDAVSGNVGEDTNVLTGTITVGGTVLTVPTDPMDPGLDPDFEQTAFDRTWQCNPELARQALFVCDPTAVLADAASRLTPELFGTLLRVADADRQCGFSSPSTSVSFSGQIGDIGVITSSITVACSLSFPSRTRVATDCLGSDTFVEGTARVTGSRKIRGYLTGNPSTPVIPTAADAIEYELDASFTDFHVSTSSVSRASLKAVSGRLRGTAKPVSALDQSTGACTLATPNVEFDDLAYTNATLEVISEQATLSLPVSASSISAIAGTKDGTSNTISGSITVGGQMFRLPVDPRSPGLDPNFDPDRFRATFACTPNLVIPTRPEMCSFRQVLGPIVARLSVSSLAVLSGVVANDQTCGFASFPVLSSPIDVTGAVGNPGSITWLVNDCGLNLGMPSAPTLVNTDCLRTQTFGAGVATVTATRTAVGQRAEQCAGPCIQTVVPLSRDAITETFSDALLAGWTAYQVDLGAENPTAQITLSGDVSFEHDPVLGEDTRSAGVFDIATPVSHFSGVELANVRAALVVDGMRFNVVVTTSSFDADVGVVQGSGNAVNGTIVLDGEPVPLMMLPLDPSYNQAVFDGSYDCTPNLAAPVPSQ